MKHATPFSKLLIWTTGVAVFAAVILLYSSALSDVKPVERHVFHLSFFSSCEPDFMLPEGEMLNVGEEKIFKVVEDGNLILSSCFGDVDIRTWDKQEVKIVWTSKKDIDELEGVEVRVEQKDETIRISGSMKDHIRRVWSSLHARFHIVVPVRFNPTVSLSGGDINLEQLEGAVTLETSGGDIDVKDVAGRVTLETSGGDITVTEIKGDVAGETSGGDVRVERIVGNIRAETSGGDIIASLLTDTSDVYCSTSGGDIILYLPENVKTDVQAETSGGAVGMKIPNFKGKIERDEIRGKINGGGSKTVLETSGGDIRILPLQ